MDHLQEEPVSFPLFDLERREKASRACVNEQIATAPSCSGAPGKMLAHASEAFGLKGGGPGVFMCPHLTAWGRAARYLNPPKADP